jgi:hypothetical protein
MAMAHIASILLKKKAGNELNESIEIGNHQNIIQK